MRLVKIMPVALGGSRVKPIFPEAGTISSALLKPEPVCHSTPFAVAATKSEPKNAAKRAIIPIKMRKKSVSAKHKADWSARGSLAKDLDCWLRGKPIAARPATFLDIGYKGIRRQPMKAALVASLAVFVISMISVLTLLSERKLVTSFSGGRSDAETAGSGRPFQAFKFSHKLMAKADGPLAFGPRVC